MPSYIVTRLADALNDHELPLRGSKVLVLGVAYKAAVSDFRDSPALELVRLLNAKGVVVTYHDPYVPSLDVDVIQMSSVELDLARLQDTDCVLVVTAHPDFDWQWIVSNSKLVFDTRNATKDVKAGPGRVVTI
jgi:UDP-N-acetyl-D-glucosamine dehydrogenase